MKALVKYYKRDSHGRPIFKNKVPVTDTIKVDFPLKFGYDPYEERILFGTGGINASDVISIDIILEEPIIQEPDIEVWSETNTDVIIPN